MFVVVVVVISAYKLHCHWYDCCFLLLPPAATVLQNNCCLATHFIHFWSYLDEVYGGQVKIIICEIINKWTCYATILNEVAINESKGF